MNESINKWSQQTLIEWVSTLNSIPKNDNKQKIINGIKTFDASGNDVFDADIDDLAENLEITRMLARKLFNEIENKRDEEFRYKQPDCTSSAEGDDTTFSVNLSGVKAKYCRIDKLKSSYTVKYLKEQYLASYGHDIQNKDKFNELKIRRMNTILENDKTLAFYEIFDDTITLTVTFRVNGGAQQLNNNDSNNNKYGNDDKYRIRKLRYKKYKQIILSNEADCIMGYTNKDGIKRAKMPCGCSYAADTMYRFMKSLFDQESNFREIIIECPMPKTQCKGTPKQRKWDWSIVFIVADLSENEKIKYNQIISNRIGEIKGCPGCGLNCERPKDLRIFRVKCKQCNKSDWCWECRRPWKGTSKTSTVCGNGNCIGERLNKILKNANMINPSWSPNIKVPEIRHCPKCFTIIEYVKYCQHMKCSGCPYEFCFKCCGPWKGHKKCTTVAPKQDIK